MQNDFCKIPGFSDYSISRSGVVRNDRLGTILTGCRNPDGYWLFRLKNDENKTLTIGRYRLLLLAFMNDSRDKSNLVGNHLDGDKTNDVLPNLEWTTYQGNLRHAGFNGLTTKNVFVQVRNVDTGVVINYPSIRDCANDLRLTKDAVVYRLLSGEKRVFPERCQYRRMCDLEWQMPSEAELRNISFGRARKILVRDVSTGSIVEFEKLTDMANHFSVSPATVTSWLKRTGQPILPGNIQIKLDPEESWREPGLGESEPKRGKTIVVVAANGDELFYDSIKLCAKAYGVGISSLHYRLQKPGGYLDCNGRVFKYSGPVSE